MIFGVSNHTRKAPYLPPFVDRDKGSLEWPLYVRFFKKYAMPYKWEILLCFIVAAVNSNYAYVVSYLSKHVVDKILVIQTQLPQDGGGHRVTEPDRHQQRAPSRPEVGRNRSIDSGRIRVVRPPEAGRKLFLFGVFYILTQFLFSWMGRYAARRRIDIATMMKSMLWDDMHRKVMELSMSFHQTMSPGRLLSRIISDVDAAQGAYFSLLATASDSLTRMLVGFFILCFLDLRMAGIVAVALPLYCIAWKCRWNSLLYFNKQQRHTNACLYGLASQKIEAAKAIQSYAREKSESTIFHRIAAVFMRDAVSARWIHMCLQANAYSIMHICNCLVLFFGGKLVLDGQMTIGKLIFIQAVTANLFQPVMEVTNMFAVLQSLQVSLSRCVSVLDHKVEITEDPNSTPFPSPISKGIVVSHLAFTYPAVKFRNSNADETGNIQVPEPVLRDVSFTVEPGTWLCIMGASGSGKTTLLHLLSRIYEPSSGSISVDGIPLDKINLRSLRHSLGVVPQEAQIFGGTIRDNIAYGFPEATNVQIMEAAKQAQMHEVILGMKVQYETVVGQKGSTLSGGQRQRLSLARALLTSPELLILDDCTSALDANTERKIQETLTEVLKGKTAIMVSQRISMAMRCHKICVLENGVISEMGTHQQLLGNHKFYAKLYTQQTGEVISK